MPVHRRMSLVGALTALCLFTGGAAAQADGGDRDRECVGAIGAETVRGDLEVPEAAVCELAGTRVLGDVKVQDGAELYAQNTTIRGGIEADPQAYVDMLASYVGDELELRDALGVSAETSRIDDNIESRDTDFIDLFSTSVDGNVKVEGLTAVFGEAVKVEGNMRAEDAQYFDLYDSEVDGNFSVRNTTEGSIFCGNKLDGDSEFVVNMGLLTIGSPSQSCAGNVVEGDVEVHYNDAVIEISDNYIKGDLECRGNEPPPLGGNNRVRGDKEGQCRNL
jgi:hypothetical protein